MSGRVVLMLCLGMLWASNVLAETDRFRAVHYPTEIYTLRAKEDYPPGTYRLKLDSRTLEVTLPEPPPDRFFMPEVVRTKGEGKEFAEKLRSQSNNPECFSALWKYGFLRGAIPSGSGGMGAAVQVVPHTRVWIKDPKARIPVGTAGDVIEGKRPVELDYFKLDDFTRAVCGEGSDDSCRVEVINGRQWVRKIWWDRWDRAMPDMPPRYKETLATPLERNRMLRMSIILNYGEDYDIPEGMPGWMRELSGNMTTMLRSIKLSPPDDGSPDPFLIDPEQKPGATLVEFPARRK